MFYYVAMKALEQAGHKVAPTNIPGLYDVEGIGNDLTLSQMVDAAQQRGLNWRPEWRGPEMNFTA